MIWILPLLLGLSQTPEEMMRELQRSHLEANIPPVAEFDRLLQRDLEKYFKAKRTKAFTLRYDALRKGPTQSGVSYPKFYVWVQVTEGTKVVEEGAVRVEAIEKREFRVTDFLSEVEIRADPLSISRVFPALVCDTIKKRLGLAR